MTFDILSGMVIDLSGALVGSERPNLLLVIRVLENAKNLVLDVLNILPKVLDVNTPHEAIDKSPLF
jgi:hypothetical protein